jgi:putative ABC transport system substrate-binding protein
MARDLARASARVILVSTIASARAAQNLMPPVPLVMLGLNTPVEVGLVASLARPGGHTTGVATLNEDLTPKLIEFQREVLPEARTLAVLFNPGNPSNPAFVDRLRLAAGHRGLTVLPIALNSSDELGSAFSTLSARRPDALQVVADSGILDVSDRIAALALELRLPSFATVSEFAQFGGLMSYGTAARRQWLRAALYVKKILDGATPADLPIERPTKIELSINLKTAIALGIAIPPTLASRADEIIE